ncbi:hypothetical protein [Sphingobacterium spiritivorum]|uniref:hypothetical protein n=1 Tax=Sphingobacterium spiritivorum TaxID=258 RepID=UPI001919F6B4|nr:hypothetical protein [Sphingobacterium spiritivorum]QQT26829.1 hypothetical protein I6J02_02895 [Sphingobacterium spiritivorum]
MDLKKSIRSLLISNFGGAQLSAARVEALAKRLEGKVTTEEELLERLKALDEAIPFQDIAKEDDRARSVQAELDKLKTPAPAPQPTPPTPVPEPAPEAEVSAKDKAILDALKALTDQVAGLKSEKVVTDRQSLILGKLANADKEYSSKVLRDFGRMNFATDEDFTAYLTDVETDFANHTQTQAESKLGKDNPFAGVGKDGKIKEATKEELDSVMNEIGL